MATYIGTDNEGKLTYVNEPDVEKTLFENTAEFTNEDKNKINDINDINDDIDDIKDDIDDIKDDIDEINEAINLTSTTMELFGNTVTIYKSGNIVQVDYFAASKIELTGSADVLVGTLPEGYRPKTRVCSQLFTSSSSKIQITFNTDGTIKVYNFGTTLSANSGWVRDYFTFFTE